MPTEPSPALRAQVFCLWRLTCHRVPPCVPLGPRALQALWSWLPGLGRTLTLRGCPLTPPSVPCTQRAASTCSALVGWSLSVAVPRGGVC